MPEVLANSVIDPTTTLNTTIDNDDLTIIVDDATELPSTGKFRILIWDGVDDTTKEIILIASRSGTTLTAQTRAVEGINGAQAHTAGDPVELVTTKGGIETAIKQRVSSLTYLTAR